MGVYASERIEAGRWVCRYEGKLVADDALATPFDPLGIVPTAVTGLEEVDRSSEYVVELCPGLYLDAQHSGHWSRYLNHAEHGNVALRCSVHEQRADFHALITIEPGEELCFNYGEGFWHASACRPEEGTDSRF